jgi:F-type H+-transporting ATPase subunit epsilon
VNTFSLSIGTPDGLLFSGEVERVVCRSITGDLAILAGHMNYCTALGMGEAHIVLPDGQTKRAACIGGMLTMMNGSCSLLATTWEWADEIDKERAERAKKKAEEKLAQSELTEQEYKLFKAKLQRALVRLSVKD